MIRVFIVGGLIWGLSLVPISSLCQDSLVHIRPSTARFFLEAHDEALALRKKDTLNSQLITNLETEILFKDKIISSYQEDSVLYKEQTQHLEETIRIYQREEVRLKRHARLTKIGAIIVLGIILIVK